MTKLAVIQIFPPKKDQQGDISYQESQALNGISSIARDLSKNDKNTSALGEYAWILSLNSQLHILSQLVVLAENGGFSYRVSFLENALQWMSFNVDKEN